MKYVQFQKSALPERCFISAYPIWSAVHQLVMSGHLSCGLSCRAAVGVCIYGLGLLH